MASYLNSGSNIASTDASYDAGNAWAATGQEERNATGTNSGQATTSYPTDYAKYPANGDVYSHASTSANAHYVHHLGQPFVTGTHIPPVASASASQFEVQGSQEGSLITSRPQNYLASHAPPVPPYGHGRLPEPYLRPAQHELWQNSAFSFEHQSHLNTSDTASSSLGHAHLSKRQRIVPGEGEDSAEEDGGLAPADAQDPAAADKSKRACARCKGLKVRCQFKRDPDTCERCLKGSHECVFPGRKLRRPPVKREVLLSKIRDQESRIEDLMKQVEALQAKGREHSIQHGTPDLPTDLTQAAISSKESPAPSADVASPASTGGESHLSRENSEWISEARQKLEASGGLMSLGSASMNRSYFVEESLENSDSSDDEFSYATVEDPDSDEEGERRAADDPMASIPTRASPFGLMARVSAQVSKKKAGGAPHGSETDIGVAYENFFRAPGPEAFLPSMDIDSHEVPSILREGIITPKQAEKLFDDYFNWMNPSLSLLDSILYTPQQVYWRSPFLFTVICAIASRYDAENPGLYQLAIAHARRAAAETFVSGPKRVEVVQAYILLSLYPVPVRRWEDDRCYIYLGQAIRIAMDMNLNHPNTARPRNELHAREMLNRTRAWLNCFNLDRSTSSQYGKIAIIPSTDYIANHSIDWWRSSAYNLQLFDIHTCAYNNELRILGEFFVRHLYTDPNHPTGLNKACRNNINIEEVASEFDDRIERTRQEWFELLKDTDQSDPVNRFRTGLLNLGYSYGRLVVLSHGFQNSFSRNNTNPNLLRRCVGAATDVISAMIDEVGIPAQRKFVRMGPDAQTVFVSFSCTFLVKLLLPRYEQHITRDERQHIIETVQRAINFHGSPDISVDDRHGPWLYSRFTAGLLENVLSRSTHPNSRLRKAADTASHGATSIPAQLANFQPRQSASDLESTIVQQELGAQVANTLYASLPATSNAQFDHFAPQSEMASYGPGHLHSQANVANFDSASFFSSPLPMDNDFLSSMQSVASLQSVQATLPGFGWMGQMPPMNVAGATTPYRRA